jgi:hypothetical protein
MTTVFSISSSSVFPPFLAQSSVLLVGVLEGCANSFDVRKVGLQSNRILVSRQVLEHRVCSKLEVWHDGLKGGLALEAVQCIYSILMLVRPLGGEIMGQLMP